jgi:hypothetical protein
MIAPMKSPPCILLAALFAFASSSCETVPVPDPTPADPHAGHGHDDPHRGETQPIPRIEWGLHGVGEGYDLDLILDRDQENHVANGGEYVSARRVSRTSRHVPAGTVSAFEVLLPDGEIDLYWVEEGRPGTLIVYRKSYDAYDDRWTSERRLRSVTY